MATTQIKSKVIHLPLTGNRLRHLTLEGPLVAVFVFRTTQSRFLDAVLATAAVCYTFYNI